MFTAFFEIEEEEKPTPTFEVIGESTSSLLECIIRLEHKELHCTIERERWDTDRFENRRSAAIYYFHDMRENPLSPWVGFSLLSFDAGSIKLHVKNMIKLRESLTSESWSITFTFLIQLSFWYRKYYHASPNLILIVVPNLPPLHLFSLLHSQKF